MSHVIYSIATTGHVWRTDVVADDAPDPAPVGAGHRKRMRLEDAPAGKASVGRPPRAMLRLAADMAALSGGSVQVDRTASGEWMLAPWREVWGPFALYAAEKLVIRDDGSAYSRATQYVPTLGYSDSRTEWTTRRAGAIGVADSAALEYAQRDAYKANHA